VRAADAVWATLIAAIVTAQPSHSPAARAAPRGPASTSPLCVTLVDGAASVLHGPARYALTEGVWLQPGDIVEVGDGLVLLERTDGAAIGLASAARVMLLRARPLAPALFVLAGWAKATSPRAEAAVRVESPSGAATMAGAVSVIEMSGGEESIFAESGRVVLDALPPLTLEPGEFCSRRAGRKPALAERPPRAFLDALPRPFLDPLPARLARFAGREVPLGKPKAFTYREVEAWLRAAPAVRRTLAAEWASKAADPAFRQALLANLQHHPEWDRVLFPEKHETTGKERP
jgi:hypothetical protein